MLPTGNVVQIPIPCHAGSQAASGAAHTTGTSRATCLCCCSHEAPLAMPAPVVLGTHELRDS